MPDDQRPLFLASFFSGTGMLDRGIHAAFGGLGFDCRTILWCENDPGAQAILQARMRDGLIDQAPIWNDIRTLDGCLLRGRVDAVVGGFPCTDLSVAGKRAGLGTTEDRTRSGLFFDLLRIATDSEARIILLENVGGIVSAASTVPEDEPGDGNEERSVSLVCGALADAGYDASWIPLRASDAGAPHGRLRVFFLGWRRD